MDEPIKFEINPMNIEQNEVNIQVLKDCQRTIKKDANGKPPGAVVLVWETQDGIEIGSNGAHLPVQAYLLGLGTAHVNNVALGVKKG